MKTLRSEIETFLRLLRSPVHISWSCKPLFERRDSRFKAYKKVLQRERKELSDLEIVQETFYSGCSPALLLNYSLSCLGKTRQDLRLFQKSLLPYVGHIVYGSPDTAVTKVLYLCDKKTVPDDEKWEDFVYNNFALKLALRRDGYDFESERGWDVVLAVLDEDGNVLRASKTNCSDLQNSLVQTAHYHRNSLTLCTKLIGPECLSVYEKCEQVTNVFFENIEHLVGHEQCKRLTLDLMILNNTDCLWQRTSFLRKHREKVCIVPQNGWTEHETHMWRFSLRSLVVEMAQLILLCAGKIEHNCAFLPDLLAKFCDDIDAERIRSFLSTSRRPLVQPKKTLQTFFNHFFDISSRESEQNLSRSSTPKTSPMRENLDRKSLKSSPFRCCNGQL